jgi:predicted enzyme related to lactoylglutathione lyase
MAKVEMRLAGTPAWFDLMTPDLEGARKFYGELFGWTFLVGPAEMGYYTMCRLGDANAAGMALRDKNAPFPSAWSIYFKSTDINASAEAVKANGGQVMMGPVDVSGEGHMVVCLDPTGAAFGFWQDGRHTGAHVADEPGAMTWADVYTRDGAKAQDFYAKVLDCEAKKMPGGMEYWTLEKNGAPKSGVMHMDDKFPKEIPAHWAVYFAVKDTDASVELIKKNGGKLNMGPFDSPYGRIAIVSDPFGATFTIIKLSMPS